MVGIAAGDRDGALPDGVGLHAVEADPGAGSDHQQEHEHGSGDAGHGPYPCSGVQAAPAAEPLIQRASRPRPAAT